MTFTPRKVTSDFDFLNGHFDVGTGAGEAAER